MGVESARSGTRAIGAIFFASLAVLFALSSFSVYHELRTAHQTRQAVYRTAIAHSTIRTRFETARLWWSHYRDALGAATVANAPLPADLGYDASFRAPLSQILAANDRSPDPLLSAGAAAGITHVIDHFNQLHRRITSLDTSPPPAMIAEAADITRDIDRLIRELDESQAALAEAAAAPFAHTTRALIVQLLIFMAIAALTAAAVVVYRRLIVAEATARNARLAAIGTLAASHTHAIHSVVAGLRLYFGVLEARGNVPPEDAHYVRAGIAQLSRISESLALVVRGQPFDDAPVPLDSVIAEILSFYAQKMPAITLHANLQPAAARAHVSSTAISIILSECIDNASRHPSSDPLEILIAASSAKGRLSITVSDNGTGLDAASAALSLEPFQTTSNSPHGGLGLFSCAALVDVLGGAFSLRPREGQRGTTACLDLPLANTRA